MGSEKSIVPLESVQVVTNEAELGNVEQRISDEPLRTRSRLRRFGENILAAGTVAATLAVALRAMQTTTLEMKKVSAWEAKQLKANVRGRGLSKEEENRQLTEIDRHTNQDSAYNGGSAPIPSPN